MIIKCFVIFGLLSALVGCYGKDLTPEKLNKNLAKINKILENSVESSDVEANMRKIEELLNAKTSKCYSFGGQSLVDTLRLLVDFTRLPRDEFEGYQDERAKSAELLDSGLADKSRLESPNYSPNRIDGIIEHYSLEIAKRLKYRKNPPTMNFGLKQLAYDKINDYLVDTLPEVNDIEANMAAVKKMLNELQPPNGALAMAIRHLLELELTSNELTCNEIGFKILLRNDLATRFNAHRFNDVPLRRVDIIFQHYAKLHANLCRQVVPKNFQAELMKLDEDTYRKVLGLLSANYLPIRDFAKIVERIKHKEINEDFTIPLLEDHINNVFESRTDGYLLDLGIWSKNTIGASKLLRYISIASYDDPDSKCLRKAVDPKLGISYVLKNKLHDFLVKYVFGPCAKFMQMFGDKIEADEYSSNMIVDYNKDGKEDFFKRIIYHTIRAGYYHCKAVTNDKYPLVFGIVEMIDKTTA